MAKVGRPSTYDPAYCAQVIELGKQGKSEAQISAAVDIPRTTLRSWAERQPEFASALARAHELSQAWWEDKGQAGLDDRNFNAPLWHKNVASRFRTEYGEKQGLELTGAGGEALLKEPDPADVAKVLLGMLGKAGT